MPTHTARKHSSQEAGCWASECPLFAALLPASLLCLVQSSILLPSPGPRPEQGSLSPWSIVHWRETAYLQILYVYNKLVSAMMGPPRERTGRKD